MPPPSISLSDVRQAIEALQAEGFHDPGVHRIRAWLKRGSVTTISKYKHQIRAEDESRCMPVTGEPVPDPVTDFAARTWEALMGEVDAIDTQRKNEAREALNQVEAELEKTRAALDDTNTERQQMEVSLEALRSQLASVSTERDQLAASLKENEILIAGQVREIDKLEQALQESKRYLADAREANDARIAALHAQLEEQKTERDSARKTVQAQIRRLEADIDHWQSRSEEQQATYEKRLAEMASKAQQAQDLAEGVRKESDDIRHALAAEQTAHARTQTALEAAQETARQQLFVAETRSVQLEQLLDAERARVAQLVDTLSRWQVQSTDNKESKEKD